jgi:hypothetical protein
MNNNLLFDMLGIMIGFSGVMLVLSLVVTALVQATVHFMALRARNLQYGLAALLAGTIKDINEPQAKELARRVLLSKHLMPGLSESVGDRLGLKLMGRRCTYVRSEHLRMALEEDRHVAPTEAGKASAGKSRAPRIKDTEDIDGVMKWFPRLEDKLKQRYLSIVRVITVVWAVLIAVYFQVSSPALLHRLSTDPEFRVQAERAARSVLDEYEELSSELLTYQDVSDRALDQLGGKYEDLALLLEEASGIGDGRADIVAELELILENRPERTAVIREYGALLDELYRKAYVQAVGVAESEVSRLAMLDITPWRAGGQFYREFSNIVGVLMTTILISFGAPFWFNKLRQLVNLGDALAPKDGRKEKPAGEQ